MITLLVLLVGAGALTWLIDRDLKRARQRRAEGVLVGGKDVTWFRSGRKGMVRVSLVLDDNFTPAVKRAAEATRTIGKALSVSELAEIIWRTSRQDESTISAIGAQHVARAVLAAGYLNPLDYRGYMAQMTYREAREEAWLEGWRANADLRPVQDNPYRAGEPA